MRHIKLTYVSFRAHVKMASGIISYVRLSVCPIDRQRTAGGGFAAERRAGGRYRSTVAAHGRRLPAAAPGPLHGERSAANASSATFTADVGS